MKKIIHIVNLFIMGAATSASAAITYSGIQNIAIPTSFSGLSLTLNRSDAAVFTPDTSATNTSGSGWDLNLFLGGAGLANSPNAQPVRESASNISFVHNLALGTSVDSGSTVSSSFGGSGFPNQHIGVGPDQFTNATSGYFGFVLDPGGAAPLYGWMKVTLDNTGSPGLVESWAFDTTPNTPILVGAVPEPSSTLLLLTVTATALLRRHRHSR